MRLTQSPHRRHSTPMLHLPFKQRLPIQRRIHIPRRYRIDSDPMPSPFSSERLGELSHRGLGGVVGALLLRVKDAGTGD